MLMNLMHFLIKQKDAQLETHQNTIRKLKAQISQLKSNRSDVIGTLFPQPLESQNFQLHNTINKLQKENDGFQAKNSKIKKHYKELYDLIKITRATHIEKITSLLNEIETLKTQGYLNCLKDTLDTLHKIVEEARSNRTSDNSLEYTCAYTKTSQELLENVITSCPKTINTRYRYNASTHAKRNKHVTFVEPLETSPNNTSTQVKQLNPSTGASRSHPKSNIKIDRTLTAKSGHKKNVDDHFMNNKSNFHKKNHVDSGISFKRVIVNSNSNSHWTVFTKVRYQWKPTGRRFTLGEQCLLTRNFKPGVGPVKQWKPTGRKIPLGCQFPLIRPLASMSARIITKSQTKHVLVAHNVVCTNQQDPNCNWGSNLPKLFIFVCVQMRVVQIVLCYLDSGCSKHMTEDRSRLKNFMKKFIRKVRFGNDHFGAIMGYGDYVIGDSVISKVYYMEGLGHNLFSVGQFCDSDLEVAFRKHSCFIRDLDGVDLIKGTRGTNLYTISIEDMMRSSPICLLSKTSKNKS
nr:integrase, catalytic region, zinc finger, CCHC-type, peptidase aspartic, catalytic [Tanacetum cinerariifolium]